MVYNQLFFKYRSLQFGLKKFTAVKNDVSTIFPIGELVHKCLYQTKLRHKIN